MRKLNGILILFVCVFGFLTLNLFIANSADDLGYAERINILEAKMNNHETRIAVLEKKPTTTTATTAQAGGQWTDLDGNTIFQPDPDTMGYASSSSHKFHFWEGCQFYAPVASYEHYKTIYPDCTPCILCMKHLVPPGNNANKAPALQKDDKSKNTTQGAVKK